MTDNATDPVLRVTMVADTSDGTERVKRFDPETGHSYLADPKTWVREDPSTWQDHPWPLLGIRLANKPAQTKVPITWVNRAMADGYVELNDTSLAHRPGGPPSNPWQSTHTFTHAKTLTIHTLDGDVVYKVVHQPDKYACSDKAASLLPDGAEVPEYDSETEVTPEIYNAGQTRVDHWYGLELVNS